MYLELKRSFLGRIYIANYNVRGQFRHLINLLINDKLVLNKNLPMAETVKVVQAIKSQIKPKCSQKIQKAKFFRLQQGYYKVADR